MIYLFLHPVVPNLQGMSMQDKDKNPFVVPIDHDIFALRDKEKQRKKQVVFSISD